MKLLAAAVLAMGGGGETEAWIFFSPDSPDASGLFRSAEGLRVRPVLLVERYFGDREPSEAFLATVRRSGEALVVDEEGLRLAERLGIRSLPAAALRVRGRIHLAAGTRADLKEILRCSR
jgi:hypothetical protein